MTSAVRAPRPTPRRQPAPPARPDLYVVGPRRARAVPRAHRTGAVLAVATVVVFGSLLASAVFHSVLVTGQTRLDDLGTQIRTEREQLRHDQLRLASYQSPERIAREAARLGMVPAERQTWISPGTGAEPVTTGEDPGPVDRQRQPSSGTDAGSGDELAAAGGPAGAR